MGFLSVKSGLKGPEVRTLPPPIVPLAGSPRQAHSLTPLIIGYPRHIYWAAILSFISFGKGPCGTSDCLAFSTSLFPHPPLPSFQLCFLVRHSFPGVTSTGGKLTVSEV